MVRNLRNQTGKQCCHLSWTTLVVWGSQWEGQGPEWSWPWAKMCHCKGQALVWGKAGAVLQWKITEGDEGHIKARKDKVTWANRRLALVPASAAPNHHCTYIWLCQAGLGQAYAWDTMMIGVGGSIDSQSSSQKWRKAYMTQKLFTIQIAKVEWEHASLQLADCHIQGVYQTQSQETQVPYCHVKHLILNW